MEKINLREPLMFESLSGELEIEMPDMVSLIRDLEGFDTILSNVALILMSNKVAYMTKAACLKIFIRILDAANAICACPDAYNVMPHQVEIFCKTRNIRGVVPQILSELAVGSRKQ